MSNLGGKVGGLVVMWVRRRLLKCKKEVKNISVMKYI